MIGYLDRDEVLEALAAEGGRLAEEMLGLVEDDFHRATPCAPWSVAELLAHVVVAGKRLPDMLGGPEPARDEVGAAEYYRPDERFAPSADGARIAAAQEDAAAAPTGHALAERFDVVWREMVALAAAEPATRVVSTRWGDAMLLTEFLATRLVEVTLHGLDLAAGLDREPWTTPQGVAVVEQVLLGAGATTAAATLGWDRLDLVRKATGRVPLTDAEARLLADRGVRRLTLGRRQAWTEPGAT